MNTEYEGFFEPPFDTLEYYPLEEFIQNAVSEICAATLEALQKHDEMIREERGI